MSLYGLRRFKFGRFFSFNDAATAEIYSLSLHDALPICQLPRAVGPHQHRAARGGARRGVDLTGAQDRKSTRLNSSHPSISYAVFCLKKKSPTTYRQCARCTAATACMVMPSRVPLRSYDL